MLRPLPINGNLTRSLVDSLAVESAVLNAREFRRAARRWRQCLAIVVEEALGAVRKELAANNALEVVYDMGRDVYSDFHTAGVAFKQPGNRFIFDFESND